VEAEVVWQAGFPGGTLSQCGASFDSASAGYVRAIGESGWFSLDPAFNYVGVRGQRSDGRPLDFPDIDQFAAEMDDFARCIQEDAPSIADGEEGLRDVRALIAIYQSARTGARVSLANV
jgi:predicted dehydrogenase